MHECVEDVIEDDLNVENFGRRQTTDRDDELILEELILEETTPQENLPSYGTESSNSEKRFQNGRTLTEVFSNHLDMEDNLDLLPNRAAPGPDGVPTSILKNGKVPMARMLCNIMKSSMNTG